MFVVATPAPPPILTTIVMAKLPRSFSPLFLNRRQAGKSQTQRFIPAIHAIERLHRISSRAFHQIVQGGDDHHALLIAIKLKADIAVVTPRQNLWFGIAIDAVTLFDQANERFTLIHLAIKPP